MGRQQRGRQLSQLALHLDALIDEPRDQLRLKHLRRGVDVALVRYHLLDETGAGFGLRFLRLGEDDLGVELGQLLGTQRGVVGAGEQALARPEPLGGFFGLGHSLAQHVDLGAEPGGGVLGLLELRLALPVDVDVGELVGDLGGEVGVAGRIIDRDHARLEERKHREVLDEGAGGLLFLRLGRFLGQPQAVEQAYHRVCAGVLGEVRIGGEIEIVDHLVGEIARGQHLHLALHRLLIKRALLYVADLAVGRPGEHRLIVLDEDACLGGIERPHHRQDDEGEHPRPDAQPENRALGAP